MRRGGSRASSFPATYEFTPRTTSAQLVDDQIEHFETNWAKVDLAAAKKKNLTPYDVLIIASMVEKETIAPDERPKVAAVIYNRLKAGMPLGIDATIRYGLDVPGTESLRVSQLESDNPYNTRNRTGLPPTPIANPGLASMQAAAHPAKVDYLYFVRKPDKDPSLLHGERVGVLRQGLRVRLRLRLTRDRRTTTALVGPAPRPEGRTRSRRGCRTRPSRRSRSTTRTSRSASRRSGSSRPCAGSSRSGSPGRT